MRFFNNHQRKETTRFSKFPMLALFIALTLVATGAQAMDDSKKKGSKKDCQNMGAKGDDTWIQGKLEGAILLNKHLNPAEIKTEVKNQTVLLTGNVDTEIEKDLAEEIAKSIEGVKEVENKLTIRPDEFKKDKEKTAKDTSSENQEREFTQKIKDASITASVKLKLLANSNTDGSDINVNTRRQVVTLKGNVESTKEKDLAEKIAMNTEDVLKVTNELEVNTSTE